MPAEHHGEPDTRSKRKQPPTPSNERPMKQMKPEDSHARNGTYATASPEPLAREQTPTPSMDMDMSVDDVAPPHIAGALHDTAEWQKTIETVVKSVVSIHFCQTCSFDTDPAIASEATGFVVDAERGYILTNRVRGSGSKHVKECADNIQHVVGAGPFIGYCIFDNHEEVDYHGDTTLT